MSLSTSSHTATSTAFSADSSADGCGGGAGGCCGGGGSAVGSSDDSLLTVGTSAPPIELSPISLFSLQKGNEMKFCGY